MPEYIEREILFEEIRKEFRPYWQIPCDYEDMVTQKMVTKMRGLIDKLTAADVVDVVRCSECKYFGKELKQGKHSCLNYQLPYCLENDYCSYGERKDDDK